MSVNRVTVRAQFDEECELLDLSIDFDGEISSDALMKADALSDLLGVLEEARQSNFEAYTREIYGRDARGPREI